MLEPLVSPGGREGGRKKTGSEGGGREVDGTKKGRGGEGRVVGKRVEGKRGARGGGRRVMYIHVPSPQFSLPLYLKALSSVIN